ncbi:MAG: hypothetical protein GY859_04960, partial [Desulfobacterales bacterium]|nr:hypothetical protein [Desulfobacterales bacterium]
MVKLKDASPWTALMHRGSLSAALEDRYGNPVANREIEYAAQWPLPKEDCPYVENANARPIMLVPPGDPCIQPVKPSYDSCQETGKQVLKQKTDAILGARVNFFPGEIPHCLYRIVATHGDLSQTFKFMAGLPPFASEAGPAVMYLAGGVYYTDARGNTINAARTGETVPIKGYVRAFIEHDEKENRTYTCENRSQTCLAPVPTAEYHWEVNFHSAGMGYRTEWASEDDIPFDYQGEGVFTAEYEVKAGLNELFVRPKCSLIAPRDRNSCERCSVPDEEIFTNRNHAFIMRLYGVDFEIEASGENNDEIVIPVDEMGFSLCDAAIPFRITPDEYEAAWAYMMIYRNDNPVAYLQVETHGQGFGVIAKGYRFTLSDRYEMELVLNYGTGAEIRSDRIRLLPSGVLTEGKPIALLRTHNLSQFDASAPGAIGAGYTDDYQPMDIRLTGPGEVRVALLDADREELAVIVPRTALPAGRHFFLVDFQTVRDGGVDPATDPRFYIKVEAGAENEDQTCTREIYYPGTLKERSLGKMLGQMLVHDVLLQDGSLNLSREDVALKGRGPALAFTRSYTSQPSARGFAPLGEGWRHGLDRTLEILGFAQHDDHPLPDWVRRNLGAFFSESEIPPPNQDWTSVNVNGTTFKKHGGYWTPERGRHGSLVE